jgi:hypothetical protein
LEHHHLRHLKELNHREKNPVIRDALTKVLQDPDNKQIWANAFRALRSVKARSKCFILLARAEKKHFTLNPSDSSGPLVPSTRETPLIPNPHVGSVPQDNGKGSVQESKHQPKRLIRKEISQPVQNRKR